LKSKKIAELVVTALEDMKGQAVRCINVEKLTAITDYMIIATGTSNTHIKALADSVVVKLKAANQKITGVEGKMQSEWVLVDAGGVVVHIMMAPMRALYNLEELWDFQTQSDATKNTVDEPVKAASKKSVARPKKKVTASKKAVASSVASTVARKDKPKRAKAPAGKKPRKPATRSSAE